MSITPLAPDGAGLPATAGPAVSRSENSAADRAVPRLLRVQHDTVYDYDAPVELAHHLGWLRPRETPQQRIRGWALAITPRPDVDAGTAVLSEPDLAAATPSPAVLPTRSEGGVDLAGGGVDVAVGGADAVDGAVTAEGAPWAVGLHGVHQSQDVWGNWRAGFFHARVHDRLEVVSSFVAELSAPVSLRPAASPPWERVAAGLRYHPGSAHDDAIEFVLPSFYAPQDGALARFAREVFRPGMPLLAGALGLMQLVHRRFEYRPAATSVSTRAPEALAQRSGVCQDFAHVMIGAMRSIGLAARYVSGYLLTQPPPGQPRLIGADASHAWVQVWCPLHGWVALDPTNAVQAGIDHVTLAWGRDYADVAPLRGVIRGGGRALPRVAVTVEPLG